MHSAPAAPAVAPAHEPPRGGPDGARPLRIARVSVGYPPRRCGWSHHAAALSAAQAAAGHDVHVFQPHPGVAGAERLTVHHVPHGPLPVEPGGSLRRVRFAWRAARALDRLAAAGTSPDVVHVHGDVPELIPLAGLVRRRGAALVLTLHGGLSQRPRYRRAARVWLPRADGIIAVSDATRAEVVALGVPADRVVTISSGVDTRFFHPASPSARGAVRARLGVPPDAMVWVAVGRLAPVKGLEYLVSAAGRLPHLAAGAVVAVLGDGPERAALEAHATRQAGGADLRFLGSVDRAALREWLTAADAMVLPSVTLPGQREGTPTAVLEAMSMGLPVVVTDSGGSAAAIEALPGLTVVPERNAAALADAMTRLTADPALRARVAAANLARATTRDWRHVAAAVDAFYGRMLARRLP